MPDFYGTDASETLNGIDGTDNIFGYGGDDTIDGRQQEDISFYRGNFEDYTVEFLENDNVRITDSVENRDGTDILSNVEYANFEDRQVGLQAGQDIVLVVDTTGSMRDDIAAVKKSAMQLLEAVFSPENGLYNSRIAVVGFNDPSSEVVLTFTDHANPEDRRAAALAAINSLTATGGGDFPEYTFEGLSIALDGRAGNWNPDASSQNIYIFGDASAKDLGKAEAVYDLAADVKALSGPNNAPVSVKINTIALGNDSVTLRDFENIAIATGGQFFRAANATELVDVLLGALSSATEDSDFITGSVRDNYIDGLGGDDTISSREGDDTIFGGSGNDYLSAGQDDDLIRGGTGSDRIESGGGDDVAYGGDGNDEIDGHRDNDLLYGNAGNDTVRGGLGTDTVFGGDGNDTVSGNQGDDIVHGNDGNDYVRGWGGNDTMLGGEDDDVLEGNEGDDWLRGGLGQDTVDGGQDADLIGGNKGDDLLRGNDGADIVRGGLGNDTIYGGRGDDFLAGNENDDLLEGREGNDTLRGGFGEDMLFGGDDTDTFVFKDGYGNDTVGDFAMGIDILHIGSAVWNGTLDQTRLDALTTVVGSDLLFSFDNGDTLTLDGVSTTTGLLTDILLI